MASLPIMAMKASFPGFSSSPQVELRWAESFSELGILEKAANDLEHWPKLKRIKDDGVAGLEKSNKIFGKNIPKEDLSKKGHSPRAMMNPLSPIWNPIIPDDQMTRYKRMAMWSAASYCDQDSLLSWTCGPRCEGLTADTHVVFTFKSSITDTVGFIAVYTDVDLQEDQIIIAFRGSVTFQNWIENMRFVKEPSPWPNSNYPLARVHTGFLDSYADIASTIRGSVTILLKRYPDSRIVVTGHSLGGAVATLCATDLKFHLGWSTKIELVSFHSPRVGNDQFAGFISHIFAMDKVDPDVGDYMSRRFTNRDDPLCHLPPEWIEFMHASQEVWVNFENQTRACDPSVGEDPNCSNSVLLPADIESHFYIWNTIFGTDCSI